MNITCNYNILPNKYAGTYFSRQKSESKAKVSAINNPYCANININPNKYGENISFKSSLPDIQLVWDVQKILDRSSVFGLKEYKKLLPKELTTMRDIGKYLLDSDNKTINFILNFGKYFSEQMHKKFPNGFIFVSLGRSPAFLGKYLEFQGEEVKYCPLSHMHTKDIENFSQDLVNAYKKYLDTIGLTNELARTTKKPIIITDYNFEGYSLRNFRKFLALSEINIYEGKKVKFCPITQCDGFKNENFIFDDCPHAEYWARPNRWDFSDRLYIEMMEDRQFPKKYTSIPKIDAKTFKAGDYYDKELNKFYQNGNKFEENYDIKRMNFLIADSIYNKT